MLYLLVVGKDEASLDAFKAGSPGIDLPNDFLALALVANGSPGIGLGKLANLALRKAKEAGAHVFGVCHADCTFGPGALGAFRLAALEGSIAGIVGRDNKGDYHWANGQGVGPGEVSTLDGCSCFFRVDSGLRFDEATFDSHHCCVEDLCLQAAARGIKSIVPAADASHRGESTSRPEWQKAYWHYRGKLDRKWDGFVFRTT